MIPLQCYAVRRSLPLRPHESYWARAEITPRLIGASLGSGLLQMRDDEIYPDPDVTSDADPANGLIRAARRHDADAIVVPPLAPSTAPAPAAETVAAT